MFGEDRMRERMLGTSFMLAGVVLILLADCLRRF